MDLNKKINHTDQPLNHTSSSDQIVPNRKSSEIENIGSSVGNRNECRVTLEDADLWRAFNRLTNEMIVTKNGRSVEFHMMKIGF